MYLILSLVLTLIAYSQQYSLLDELHKLEAPNYFASKIKGIVQSQRSEHLSLCLQQLNEYANALNHTHDEWALRMFDASGKLAPGLLERNIDMGSFDECLGVQSPKQPYIVGQYCIGTITLQVPKEWRHVLLNLNATDVVIPEMFNLKLRTTSIKLKHAFCLPSSCSAFELNSILRAVNVTVAFSAQDCQTKSGQPKLDAGAIVFICFIAIILVIMLLSTLYETYYYYKERDAPHQLLISFSILNNGQKLLRTSRNPDVISCLHGVRSMSLIWVVVGHTYTWQVAYPAKNYSYIFEWLNDVGSMFIIEAPTAVDSFLLISGLAISYSYLIYIRKGKKFNLFLFYVHRYLRLTPVLAVVLLFYLTLLRYMVAGPLWPGIISSVTEKCTQNWWRVLLYVQNYSNMEELCLGQTWYLSVDTQLYILSPIILLPLSIWPKATLIGTGILTVLSMISCFITGWYFELNGVITGNIHDGDKLRNYLEFYYNATHTRAAAWLIGVLYGYFLFRVKNSHSRFTLNKILVLILWIISLAVLVTCVYGGHNLLLEKSINKLENSLYLALVRPAWAVALGWIIFCCFIGYGGPVNWFLSLPAFEVLGKLSYCIYLVHCVFGFIHGGQMRSTQTFSNYNTMIQFWGYFAFSVMFSVILYLGVEYPLASIEQRLIGRLSGTPREKVKKVDHDCKTIEVSFRKEP